jgi:type II secretory pathway predicted ATPase ExeA
MYRKRFGLTHHPLPRDAEGTTYYDRDDAYVRLGRVFRWLADEPGLGMLTGEAGVGKTAAIRNLCAGLSTPEYRVLYLCDTALRPAAVYRNLAATLGLQPKRSRDALWRQLRDTIIHLVDVESVVPVLVIDEAQHLGSDFFIDLASFLNYAFDTRDLLTVWLVGLPALAQRLALREHAALRTRIVSPNVLHPRGRDAFFAMLEHGLRTAGATSKLLSDPALEVIWRVSQGLPRTASRLLRASLMLAHERDLRFVDEHIVLDACDELMLERPTLDPRLGAKSRDKRGTKSRG